MIMEKLSVVIITKNEEENISRCLKSVEWADEIVVVDSGSTDKTADICREFEVVFIETAWKGFGATKDFAVAKAKNNWILSVDADEVVSDELKKEIIAVLRDNQRKDGYNIRFTLFYLGKKILFSGVRNEYHLRLFDRRKGGFEKTKIHEGIKINGDIGVLDNPVYHYSYPSVSLHLDKIKRYSFLSAKKKFETGKKVSLFGIIFRSLFTFIRNYILLGGFLDGRAGFVFTMNSAVYTYFNYLFLWELNYKKKNRGT